MSKFETTLTAMGKTLRALLAANFDNVTEQDRKDLYTASTLILGVATHINLRGVSPRKKGNVTHG